MVRRRVYDFKCKACGTIMSDVIVDIDSTVAPNDSCNCGSSDFEKLCTINPIGINTSKVSQSYIDGTGRFNKQREQRAYEKQLKAARDAGNRDEAASVAKECLEKGMMIKGSVEAIGSKQIADTVKKGI